MPISSLFRLELNLNEFYFHLKCLDFHLCPFRLSCAAFWPVFYITAFIKSRVLVSQIAVESGPVSAGPRTVQPQNHLIMSPVPSDFVLWGLVLPLCGSLLAVYICLTGIVYSERCTPLVYNTCWVGWEHYISHYFKITNNLEFFALIKVWVYRKSWYSLKLCVDLGIIHNTTAVILIS